MTTRIRESRTTAPATSAVDLQQAKQWLRVSDSDVADEAVVVGLLQAAVEACEMYTGRALITQTWTAFLDAWPRVPSSDDYWEGVKQGPETMLFNPARGLELRRGPLQSVTSITSYDDSDAATVYAASSYFVDTVTNRIVLRTSATPPLPTRVANGIKIIYVAGYGDDPDDVPETLRQGVLAYTAHLYEHRGDDDLAMMPMPPVVRIAWESYRMTRLWQ